MRDIDSDYHRQNSSCNSDDTKKRNFQYIFEINVTKIKLKSGDRV